MLQTALRWMGARWWAAAAVAATVIVLFRMGGVAAPSSTLPHSSGVSMAGAETFGDGLSGTNMYGAQVANASFRKEPASALSEASSLEFLALRKELADVKRDLRINRERAELYSESYEDISRQYGEISRLAALLMGEADGARKGQGRTPAETAMVERALTLLEQAGYGTRADAAQVNPPAQRHSSIHAHVQPASAPRDVALVPVPNEALFIHTVQTGNEPTK